METTFRQSQLDVLSHELLFFMDRIITDVQGLCRCLTRETRFTAGYEFNIDDVTVPSPDLPHTAKFETATEK